MEKFEFKPLSSCPRCGALPEWRQSFTFSGDSGSKITISPSLNLGDPRNEHFLQCSDSTCGIRSPLFQDRQAAIAWWNYQPWRAARADLEAAHQGFLVRVLRELEKVTDQTAALTLLLEARCKKA